MGRFARSARGTTLRARAAAGTTRTRQGRRCARCDSVAIRLMAARRSGLMSANGEDSLVARTSTSPSPVSSASARPLPKKKATSCAARRALSRSSTTSTTRLPPRAAAATRAGAAQPRTPATSSRPQSSVRMAAATSRIRRAATPSGGSTVCGGSSSSAVISGGAGGRLVRWVRLNTNARHATPAHARDLRAPARGQCNLVAHPRQAAQKVDDERAHQLGQIRRGNVDSDRAELVHRGAPVDLPGRGGSRNRNDLLGLFVELVTNFADDLFEQVLHGHEAAGAAVLVDHDRDRDLFSLHLAEHVDSTLDLRDEKHVAPKGAKVGEASRIAMEQKVARVEIAHHLVERAATREQNARVLVGPQKRVRFGPAGRDGKRDDVDTRHHRVARRALRKAKHSLEELGQGPTLGRTRRAGGQNRQNFVLAEAPFDARYVGRHAHREQDEARSVLEEPQQRKEGEVDDPEGNRRRKRRRLRALDCDKLGDELPEKDVPER